MKHIVIAIIGFVTLSAKAQCIFIYASEKFKGAEIPIVRTEFEVVINDTTKKKLTSKNDGSLGRISLEPGTYKVKISNEEFTTGLRDSVVVIESKTTDVIIQMERLSVIKKEEDEEKKKSVK